MTLNVTYAWLIPLLSAIATAALAILVNRVGPRTELRRVFTFLAGMLVLWNLNFFVLYAVSNHDLALHLTQWARVGGLFAPPAVLHLVVALRPNRSSRWRTALLIDYGFACVLLVLNGLGLLVADVRPFAWGYSSVGTSFYNLLTISVFGNFAATVALLLYDYRTGTEAGLRLQLKFWILGALIALPLALTNLLPAYGISVYPLGSLGVAVFAGIVAYAIVRHRLMDIDLVLTKSVAYGAVSFLLIAPAFGLALWLQRESFGRIHSDFSLAILLMLIAVGVLFPALRLRAESSIERSLFREKHEYRAALAAFTRSIVRILDRDKLLSELTNTLTNLLHLDRLALLLDDGERTYLVRHATGIPAAIGEFGSTHELILTLRRRDDIALRGELEASSDATERAAAETFRKNGWEVAMPLAVSDRLIGFIALGRKRNLEAFYAEDLQLLSTLAAEASIALENARLYEELKRSRDIIERTGRLSALGTLAAGIAHEIRNPLVSIQTFFQLAPQRRHDPEFFTSFLSLTAGEVDRIGDLITELLSFARSPSHRVEDVDINDLIERTTLLLAPEARKSRVKLARVLATDLPVIRADGDQLKQVVINLVLNAIQATPASGTVTVLTRRHRHQGNPLCQIEVRDTGVGIPPKMIEDIFNPFFTTKDKGTGLGLSIAHQIATEHGGFITVTSEMDRGSSFYVNLPLTSSIDSHTTNDEPEAALPLRYGRMAKL